MVPKLWSESPGGPGRYCKGAARGFHVFKNTFILKILKIIIIIIPYQFFSVVLNKILLSNLWQTACCLCFLKNIFREIQFMSREASQDFRTFGHLRAVAVLTLVGFKG